MQETTDVPVGNSSSWVHGARICMGGPPLCISPLLGCLSPSLLLAMPVLACVKEPWKATPKRPFWNQALSPQPRDTTEIT